MRIFVRFKNEFSISSPTTCNYQCPRTNLSSENADVTVNVCQVFLMLGLGISCRVCNYWSRVLMVRSFQHNTCMPLFVCQGEVFFGDYPYIDIFAWGAGNNSTTNTTNALGN